MGAPWERYQAQQAEDGPWSKFAPQPNIEPKVEAVSEPSALSKLNPMNNPLVRGAYGLAEGGTNMLTGMGGMALGGLRGIASLASGEGANVAARKIHGLADALTYAPRTAEGEVTSQALALPVELASKLGGFVGRNSEIAKLTGTQDKAEAILEVAPQIALTLLGGRSALKSARTAADATAATKLRENIRKSEMDAPRIEAAQLAAKYGIAINPAQSNPSFVNTIRAKMAGEKKLAVELHEANQYKPVEIIRNELGIEGAGPISMADINKVRAEAAKPKEAIKQIGEFTDDGTTVSAVQGLRQDTLIGGKGVAKKLNTLITDAENFISTNPSGSQMMAQIDVLRETARNIKKKDSPKKKELAEARTSLGIANALEAMIERNLEKTGNADLLNQYREGRKLSAKTFVAEDIIDFNTGKAKVADLAKMTSGDTALTGAMADLGKIYGNFPEAMRIKEGGFGLADANELGQTHLLRAGVPGTIGAIAGLPFGQPVIGGAIGATLGEAIGARQARKIVSPEFQKSHAIPTDYRPKQPRIVEINKDIPYKLPELNPSEQSGPLPAINSLVIPGSWQEGLFGRQTGKSEPIGIPDQLLPLSEQYPKGIPIGAAEGKVNPTRTPLPTLPPQGRGLLSLADEGPPTSAPAVQRPPMDFPLRQEVLQQLEPQITAFRREAARLEEIANNKYPITGKPQAEARAQLAKLQQEFAAGMRQLGIDVPQEAIGLQPLYQSGAPTKLPIQKTRGLLD